MDIKITNINLKLSDGQLVGANIYFTGKVDTISISGYIPVTTEEYNGKTYEELQELVYERIIEKLQFPVE